MTDLKITLIRSAAHRLPNQRKVVKALGCLLYTSDAADDTR